MGISEVLGEVASPQDCHFNLRLSRYETFLLAMWYDDIWQWYIDMMATSRPGYPEF